jgi:hypothetical protein
MSLLRSQRCVTGSTSCLTTASDCSRATPGATSATQRSSRSSPSSTAGGRGCSHDHVAPVQCQLQALPPDPLAVRARRRDDRHAPLPAPCARRRGEGLRRHPRPAAGVEGAHRDRRRSGVGARVLRHSLDRRPPLPGGGPRDDEHPPPVLRQRLPLRELPDAAVAWAALPEEARLAARPRGRLQHRRAARYQRTLGGSSVEWRDTRPAGEASANWRNRANALMVVGDA